MPLPKVSGVFRVGSDYEIRFAPSGIAVGTFRCVGSQSKKLDNGEWETTAEIWVSVTVFGKLAEVYAEMGIEKGVEVDVLGNISLEEWTTKEGEKRSGVKIIADAVGVRPKRERDGQQTRSAPAQQAAGRSGDPDPWGGTTESQSEPPF